MKARLKASYDAIAPKYNEWTIPHSTQRLKYLRKLLERLPLADSSRKLRVLELGCGCGIPVTQELLSHPTIAVIANDLSSTQIQLARENLAESPGVGSDDDDERLSFREGDMNAVLSFPEASLDAVLGLYSIIHLPRAEQAELLAKIGRWLKPGGYLLANFAEDEMEGLVMEHWLDADGWMFWSGWGQKRTLELLQQAGLDVVVGEVAGDVVDDASFLWVIAKKRVT